MQRIILFTLLFIETILSQFKLSQDSVIFNEIKIEQKDSVQIVFYNYTNKSININRIILSDSSFFTSQKNFQIELNDSLGVYIFYQPAQNIINQDVITFISDDNKNVVCLRVQGSGKYKDLYDSFTFNLFDNELKSALTNYVSNHTSLGYDIARDRMFDTIDKLNGDTIECVYTGKKIKASNRSEAQNKGFNTEHTYPQGFFDENEPMRSDLFHLYPTESNSNSARSNYPFGIVVSNMTYNVGGSKLGDNSSGQIVFEPRDKHKGNVARSLFYFIIRYPNNYSNYFNQASQEGTFRIWNKFDKVDTLELQRNSFIENYQTKRNPFIDHPEFVDRIFSFSSNQTKPLLSRFDIYPDEIIFDSTLVNDTVKTKLFLVNYGDKTINIDSIRSTDSSIILTPLSNKLDKKNFIEYDIQITSPSQKNINSTIKIYSELGEKQISVNGIFYDFTNVENDNKLPSSYTLEQNYPNPFNPNTIISYNLPVKSNVVIKIFDILGKEVATLVNETKEAGYHKVEFSAKGGGKGLSSGMYFYELRSGSFVQIKKMLLLK